MALWNRNYLSLTPSFPMSPLQQRALDIGSELLVVRHISAQVLTCRTSKPK